MQTVWVELVFVVFSFFVVAPAIAATIGYAARKGKPKSFDREMCWTTFVATGVVAGIIVCTSHAHRRCYVAAFAATRDSGARRSPVRRLPRFRSRHFMRRHYSLPKTFD